MAVLMADELLTGILGSSHLRVLLASTGGLVRKGRDLHQCNAASAAMLAQGLTAGLLMASLQKEDSRINLQLECDGPLRGMFVDASSRGTARGYVKNTNVQFHGTPGRFEWRPVLGNSGYLSILRDRGEGDFYRSATKLEDFELAKDLEHFFAQSEQLPTSVLLESVASPEEPLRCVAGLFLQPLPNGDREALAHHAQRLREPSGLAQVLERAPEAPASSWLEALFPDEPVNVLSQTPLAFQCTCSRERVLTALASIGKKELEDLLATDGKAEMTCEFCMTRYDISGVELRMLLTGGVQA
jgi:molecular chaperone Hsp33